MDFGFLGAGVERRGDRDTLYAVPNIFERQNEHAVLRE
jgi:hypothetical protein